MRLTTRTNLASRVLMFCGVNAGRTVRSAEIAATCNASENHLAQVIHQLQHNGFVRTLRGRGGGLSLARAPEAISMGAVFRVFEAGLPFAECFSAESNTCPLTESCRLRSFIARAVEAFYHEMDMVTLDDLIRGNCGLHSLLAMEERLMQPNCPATDGAAQPMAAIPAA